MNTAKQPMFSTTHLLIIAAVAVVGALLSDYVWNPVATAVTPLVPFLGPLGWIAMSGLYLITPVLIGLLLQRPGAATVYGVVQGVLEALFGSFFGAQAILFAGLEGLGVDLGLAPFRWRASLPGAMLAGAVGNLIIDEVYIIFSGFAEASAYNLIVGGLVAIISGAVFGGLLAWLLAQALHRTGVTAGLSGQGYEVIK
jgi:energy-coupling factor transport system substrate-specific component